MQQKYCTPSDLPRIKLQTCPKIRIGLLLLFPGLLLSQTVPVFGVILCSFIPSSSLSLDPLPFSFFFKLLDDGTGLLQEGV